MDTQCKVRLGHIRFLTELSWTIMDFHGPPHEELVTLILMSIFHDLRL